MKTNKHVENFKSKHLQNGEAAVAWAEGYIGRLMGQGKDKQYNGALIVTDIRVAFYRKGLLGEVIENIPLKAITSIERKSILGHRSIKMHTSHDDLEFKTCNKEGEALLIAAIEAGRHLSANPTASQTISTTADPYEQLKKLAELKAAGILSEEEFQDKKAKIMELI
ncbi:SHOCT domain-containing protein [Winslowiella sp. 2C04]|uniref:SHOCT domain-containing protein n=1 Tax=Winslowiella sp. 2C04 TaxID=3416179 RepID=UPI003CF933B2